MRELFKIKGFRPYIAIVFLNAMTDLGHKIVLQNTVFKSYGGSELIVLTAVINALILLPFILLFSPSGYISDRFKKTKVIKYSSLFAVGITVMILISYRFGLFWVAFFLTFVLAAQSAIYSPAKYGLIKEMVGSRNLAGANAVVQSVTVVSILAGAVVYSIFFEYLLKDAYSEPSAILQKIYPLGFLLVFASVLEFFLAKDLDRKLELEEPSEKEPFKPKLYFNFTYLKKNLRNIHESKIVWESIIGLSVLWGIAQVVVAIFPEHLKSSLGITNTVVAQGLLTLSGAGMILGSLFAGRVSKNFIEIGIIPVGTLGITAVLFLIPNMSDLEVLGLLIFLFGFFSALLVVPLNSLIQFFTPQKELGTVLAGNNFMQNVFMFLFLALTALFGYLNLSSYALFNLIASVAAGGVVYTLIKMPQSLVRYIVRTIVRMRYDIEVEGIENLEHRRGILLLGNHISFLDWAILQIAYPRQIRFVVERSYYERWYLKPFLKFAKTIPISNKGSKNALSKVAKALNEGRIVAIFPEGHISRNGHLDEFKSGFERAVKGVKDAVIVPFYLRGLWEDNFSYASKKLKNSKKKDISVTFGKPMPITSTAKEVKKAVFELSIKSWQNYAERLDPIGYAWIDNLKEDSGKLAVADSTGVELSKSRFATAVFLFGGKLKSRLKEKNVGIILPSTAAGLIANMAVITLGKTVVNLNYSSGIKSLKYALDLADIKTIITSRRFIEKLSFKGFDLKEILSLVTVIYLEDIKKEISKVSSLLTFLAVKTLPTAVLKAVYLKRVSINDTAAVLFSSGSEGRPKGIELTHKNIMGNIKQILTLINPRDDDVILGTLPMFHSFGLTVTSLLPLVEDITVAAHPDPTDGLGVAKLCAKYKATFMFGTATFYGLYIRNRKIHPLMFESLRMVVAGAEKLPQKIREDFKVRYGHEIYEGYGATETTPVASVNLPDILMVEDDFKVQKGNKPGSVGLPVPGSSFKIVDPESFEELPTGEAGMILIGGTQIMKGYVKNPRKTEEVIKIIDGIRWYVTGDKGYLDQEGFLTIIDRYSRFAKIGGEMVSLGLVEEEIFKVLKEGERISLAAVPDSKKGEKIVLMLEGDTSVEELKDKIKSLNLNPLFLPSLYFKVEEIPKLGSGKTDLKGAKNLALKLVGEKRS